MMRTRRTKMTVMADINVNKYFETLGFDRFLPVNYGSSSLHDSQYKDDDDDDGNRRCFSRKHPIYTVIIKKKQEYIRKQWIIKPKHIDTIDRKRSINRRYSFYIKYTSKN